MKTGSGASWRIDHCTSDTLAKMIKSQEHMQESLRQTIDAFNATSTGIQKLINDYIQVQAKEPDKATTEETEEEEAKTEEEEAKTEGG